MFHISKQVFILTLISLPLWANTPTSDRPVEMPWQQELSNTSSGYTDHEAAGKVNYYLQQDLKDWKGLCEVGQGKFRSEFGKIQCRNFYPEWWECTGTATAYCDL